MITFNTPGKNNTVKTLTAALEKAKEKKINYIVIASNEGYTVEELLNQAGEDAKNINICCVTHHVGYKGPGEDEMDADTRSSLESQGVKLLTTTHLFANIERAVTGDFGGLYPGGIVSHTLRCFGQGMKVCFEISTMALDAGMIPYGEDIIAIGGSGRGADAAVIISPAHGKDFFKTRVREIICMPNSG